MSAVFLFYQSQGSWQGPTNLAMAMDLSTVCIQMCIVLEEKKKNIGFRYTGNQSYVKLKEVAGQW